MVTQNITNLAPFWSGVASDSMLNELANLFDRCSNSNGKCINCPLGLQCRQLWDEAVVQSVMHPSHGLSAMKLRYFAMKFQNLSQKL